MLWVKGMPRMVTKAGMASVMSAQLISYTADMKMSTPMSTRMGPVAMKGTLLQGGTGRPYDQLVGLCSKCALCHQMCFVSPAGPAHQVMLTNQCLKPVHMHGNTGRWRPTLLLF
jgi:hypothetical protein